MQKKIILIITICILSYGPTLSFKYRFDYKLPIHSLINQAVEKVKINIDIFHNTDSLPRSILNRQKSWQKTDVNSWTSGFWPGILWYAYEATGDSTFLQNARKFTKPLKKVLHVPVRDHDLGFMIYCSFGNGYRLTKDSTYRDVLLVAADSLATLFNPKVGTILSWPFRVKTNNWPHNTIIDNMINLELLFWASKNGGSQNLYEIAKRHAETCMKTLIRPDYTTYHVAVFDTIDGHFIEGKTFQGYNDNSMWSRGQAWAIYGYAMTARETDDNKFANVAMKLANVFLANLPEDGIPYWDFDDPNIPDAPKDVSAAAIAASGMLELSGVLEDEQLKKKYLNAALDLLGNLSSREYLSGENNRAILLHSTGDFPRGGEIDVSIIYADYYYLEALLRAKEIKYTD